MTEMAPITAEELDQEVELEARQEDIVAANLSAFEPAHSTFFDRLRDRVFFIRKAKNSKTLIPERVHVPDAGMVVRNLFQIEVLFGTPVKPIDSLFGRSDRADLKSTPADASLKAVSTLLANDYRKAVLSEQHFIDNDFFEPLLQIQVSKIELLLRHFFWNDTIGIADHVLSQIEDPNIRRRFDSYLSGSVPPPLGATCQMVPKIRAALQVKDPAFLEWSQRNFASTTNRFGSENIDVCARLADRDFSHFLDWLREFRNPLMHGCLNSFAASDYVMWCATTYATQSLQQWIEVGVHPGLFRTHHFGWISFLAASWRGASIGASPSRA